MKRRRRGRGAKRVKASVGLRKKVGGTDHDPSLPRLEDDFPLPTSGDEPSVLPGLDGGGRPPEDGGSLPGAAELADDLSRTGHVRFIRPFPTNVNDLVVQTNRASFSYEFF